MRMRVLLVVVLGTFALALPAAEATMASSTAGSAGPTLTLRGSQYGRVLFDGSTRALYAFTRDPRGRSACYGACAAAWPPYIVSGRLTAGRGTSRSLFGTTRRRDGTRQLTYAGRPLYYYVADPVGRVLCQNVVEFGGLWLVVRGNGKLVRLPR